VLITPRPRGAPLTWTGRRWTAELEHFDAADEEVAALNRAMGAFARHAVFGPTQSAVVAASADLAAADRLTAGLFEVLDPASHLYDYFRVLAALGSAPAEDGPVTSAIDWSCISEDDWSAPIVFEALFPERSGGGVSIRDNRLTIDLTYGIEQRRVRRATGDFRMGALSLIDLPALRAAEPRVDEPTPSVVAADASGRRQIKLEGGAAPTTTSTWATRYWRVANMRLPRRHLAVQTRPATLPLRSTSGTSVEWREISVALGLRFAALRDAATRTARSTSACSYEIREISAVPRPHSGSPMTKATRLHRHT